jgi:hypothetical protein
LLLAFSAQAAQTISSACLSEVAAKLEFRFTFNPTDGRLYAWERHNTLVWGTVVWHSCFLYWIQPGSGITTGFPLSNETVAGLRSVANIANGKWFQTNAGGIEQDQSGLDWCTQ